MEYSLILSGGGALGYFHLNEIKKLKIYPNEIIGTSMGGIIGSLLAKNLSYKEIYNILYKFSNITSWAKLSFKNSLISTENIRNIFYNIHGNNTLDQLEIDLKLIATDLSNGNCKIFDKNSNVKIVDALLATMAIPGIFPPVEIEKVYYGDGFLSANLGIQFSSYNNILAIDVLGKNSFKQKIYKINEMFNKSLRLLIYNQTRCNLDNFVIDKNVSITLIEPYTKNFNPYNFNKFKEIVV